MLATTDLCLDSWWPHGGLISAPEVICHLFAYARVWIVYPRRHQIGHIPACQTNGKHKLLLNPVEAARLVTAELERNLELALGCGPPGAHHRSK